MLSLENPRIWPSRWYRHLAEATGWLAKWAHIRMTLRYVVATEHGRLSAFTVGLSLNSKGSTTRCFPFFLLIFWSCSIEYLQEIGSPSSHPAMNICFRRLDVIVEVVSESLYVRDAFFSALWCQMSWEQN